MPHTLIPTTAATMNITLVPLAPDVWNAAPTMLLPPAKPAPPVPIPAGVYLIPTDMLPPAMLDVAPRAPSSIPPPAMVGPICVVSIAAALPAPVSHAPTESVVVIKTPAPLPIADFPLERCAAIAAIIALRPTETATILDTHKLDAPTWQALERHWSATIKAALDDGDALPLRAYDAAFVASLEQQRGPITADDHARIVAARGRGQCADALKTLGLPVNAALPIERVLLQRACVA